MAEPFHVDFLGIGPAKAGTTWLGHMLEAHPQICMAEPKEVHFFNDSLSFNRSYDNVHFPLGLTWYAKHFAHCRTGQLKGEVTPRYIIDPVVPRRLIEHNPHLKLIVCLRPPFERIVSHFHSARDYHHSEPRPIHQAIREEPEYIEACLYAKNISRFLSYFPMEQFFFVDMDEVKSQPRELLSRLYTFLHVDPSFVPSTLFQKSNPARTTRSVWFRKWTGGIHRRMVSWGMSPMIRLMKKAGVGKWINRMNSAPVTIVRLSEEDKDYIRQRLEPDIRQLEILLNKDFSHWLK